jgi:hypothetical protein
MSMVFRTPGPQRHPTRGFRYDMRAYATAEEHAELLADGWHDTLDAAAGLGSDVVPVAAPAANDGAPTRDEMLAQAEKLGLAVDKRWGDKRLLVEIEAAMK